MGVHRCVFCVFITLWKFISFPRFSVAFWCFTSENHWKFISFPLFSFAFLCFTHKTIGNSLVFLCFFNGFLCFTKSIGNSMVFFCFSNIFPNNQMVRPNPNNGGVLPSPSPPWGVAVPRSCTLPLRLHALKGFIRLCKAL